MCVFVLQQDCGAWGGTSCRWQQPEVTRGVWRKGMHFCDIYYWLL